MDALSYGAGFGLLAFSGDGGISCMDGFCSGVCIPWMGLPTCEQQGGIKMRCLLGNLLLQKEPAQICFCMGSGGFR